MKRTKPPLINPAGASTLAAAALAAAVLLSACPPANDPTVLPWSSRVIAYHPYDAEGAASYSPAFTVVYGPDGLANGRFEMAYDAEGKPTRTDIFQYDEAGTAKSAIGYYLYSYDGDGRITRGEAYSAEGELGEYYVVAYDAFGNYTSILDYVQEESGPRATHSHYVTWADPAAGLYRQERYYKFDDAGTTESLQREYQAYYDSTDRLIAELYHVVRSTDGAIGGDILPSGSNEGYFWVQYSDDAEGLTYLQSDNWYGNPSDAAGLPTDLGANRPDFDPALVYPINPSFIGSNAGLLMTEYDADGNWIKDSRFLFGVLQETVSYSWLDASRISETSRYVNGGRTLDQRDAVRYYDSTVGGQAYAAVETTTWYLGSDPADNLDAAASNARSRRVAANRRQAAVDAGFLPSGTGGPELVRAIGRYIHRNLGDKHARD